MSDTVRIKCWPRWFEGEKSYFKMLGRLQNQVTEANIDLISNWGSRSRKCELVGFSVERLLEVLSENRDQFDVFRLDLLYPWQSGDVTRLYIDVDAHGDLSAAFEELAIYVRQADGFDMVDCVAISPLCTPELNPHLPRRDLCEQFLANLDGHPQADEFRRALNSTNWNFAGLFACLAGCYDETPDENPFEHITASFEHDYRILADCTVYHRDVREFGRDFSRAYLAMRYENMLQIYFSDEQWTWDRIHFPSSGDLLARPVEHDFADLGRWLCNPATVSKQQHQEWGRFLESITFERALQLEQLSADESRALIKQAVADTPPTWMCDLGDKGVIVGIHSLSNLRWFYRRFAQLCGIIPSEAWGGK